MLSLREIPSTLCKGASLCEVFFDFHDDCEYEREAFFSLYSALEVKPALRRVATADPCPTVVEDARVSTWNSEPQSRQGDDPLQSPRVLLEAFGARGTGAWAGRGVTLQY